MAGADLSFRSMKQLRVLLLPPGQAASPSQGYPQQHVASTHLYTWVKRDNVGQSNLSKETTQWQGLASNHRPSDLKSNTLTTTTPCPHKVTNKGIFKYSKKYSCIGKN